ncbi:MAG: SpoIIE family protein phosphatase [Victivallaceae bacterium]|nr:SpoIIE family protein phosphatase [Victivallaceae bacterium]
MQKDSEKNRIMIIDDTVENLSLLNKLLSEQGYEVSLFPKAELALKALKLNIPKLILLDINMPGMNGFEFCEAVKKNEDYQDIPIIFLSAMQDIKDKLNAFQTGGIDYITKPFQFDEVLIRVKTHMKLRQQQQELEENYRQLQLLEKCVEKRTIELEHSNKALEESLGKLQQDEEAGRIVQFKLRPKNKTVIFDYKFEYCLRPSLYMSGDFVDYFDIDENYAAFYITDVSGHGAASAFLTFLLKSFINSCRDNYHARHDDVIITPNALLSKFNKYLYEEELDKYITMFYGVLVKNENKLIFANGGHFPFPFIYHDNDIEWLSEKSTPIGMFDFSEYKNVSISLPDNFTFTIFSDGILELLPEKNIKDQIDYLKVVLKDAELDINKFVDKLTDGDTPLLDDITILSFKKGKRNE